MPSSTINLSIKVSFVKNKVYFQILSKKAL